MKPFIISNPTKIYFGIGQIARAPKLIQAFGNKALIVTGNKNSKSSQYFKKLLTGLDKLKVNYIIYDKVTPNPSAEMVDNAINITNGNNINVIVAFGGGSCIDTAKGLAITTLSKKPIWKYVDGTYDVKSSIPVIAIPTTAGTGSEVTKYAVFSNPLNKYKSDITNDLIYPKIAIVDPRLTFSLPVDISKATGIDALSQAIEGYLHINSTPYTDMLVEIAVPLLIENLPLICKSPNDVSARSNVMYASTLSGLIIDNSGVILPHAMEHPLSGHLNISHGAGLAALMPSVLEFMSPFSKLKINNLRSMFINKLNLNRSLQSLFRYFLKSIDYELTLTSLNCDKKDLHKYVDDAFITMEGCIKNSPKIPSMKEVYDIYLSSF